MAFSASGLEVRQSNAWAGIGPSNNLRLGFYVTTDTFATVEAANYFNAAYDRLPVGTILTIVAVFSGTPRLKQFVVTASSSSAVTIALQATTAG